MDNQNLGRVSVKTANRPRAKFNLRHEVDTSASFGDCQPLMCKEVVPGTKSVFSTDTLIRLAPMVAPTHSRLGLRVLSKFVGMSELTENFPMLMTQQSVTRGSNSFVPSKVPHIDNRILSAMCLVGASFTIYQAVSNINDSSVETDLRLYTSQTNRDAIISILGDIGASYANSPAGYLQNRFFDLNPLPDWKGFWSVSTSQAQMQSINIGLLLGLVDSNSSAVDFWIPTAHTNPRLDAFVNPIPLDTADEVFVVRVSGKSTSGTSTTGVYHIAFRLSDFGKRLRKALIGCGYQFNLDIPQEVSLMPLFAWYKAYYDSFAPLLYDKWENNCVYALLRQYDDYNTHDFGVAFADEDISVSKFWHKNFIDFIYRLGTTFYTEEQDFVSAHIRSLAVSPSTEVPSHEALGDVAVPNSPTNGVSINDYGTQSMPPAAQGWIGHSYHSSGTFSQLDLEYLKKLYQWTNRNTIAGQRIEQLLRAQGLGKYVDECKSHFIGESYVQINVSDIDATADSTNSVTSSTLGEYVGKGFGYGEGKSMTYENDEYGYVVILGVIIPESSYCQSQDLRVLNISKMDFYHPDFDGMGFEANPKSIVCGQMDWNELPVAGTNHEGLGATFGFVPRYSRLKTMGNKINGNFSRRGARDGYLPYVLDKFIPVGDRVITSVTEDSNYTSYVVQKAFSPVNMPCATPNYRYVGRFPWLGHFNRIFNNAGKDPSLWYDRDYDSQNGVHYLDQFTRDDDDNFMLFNFIDLVEYAPMLPIEDSFETKEDGNKGGSDISEGKA